MRRFFPVLLLVCTLPVVRGKDTALLREVANNWLDQQDRWAFTQLVREYDSKGLKQERVERYDPSKAEASRWLLISIDGRRPTPTEWADWTRRKNKKHRRPTPSLTNNFEFANARVIEETARTVRYELPLRSSVEWLFPVNKVELIVTINKTGPALEQVHARINEPFRVALGLARILNIDLDLQMTPPPAPDPANARPTGQASAVVSKHGDRVEYFWSDFKHVTPHPVVGD